MAQAPSKSEAIEAQVETATLIDEKLSDQQAQGKDFKLPEGGGPGVIPEEVWKEMK